MDKLIVKVLGTPIGGVSDVDGDGDGFRTGPGGKDNIPVAPKQLKRTLQEKIKDGPLNFVAGLDNERKIPRVFGDEEALSRYGSTRKGMQEYALTKYGVSLSFAEETKEQKTSRIKNIKNGLAQSRPDLSKGEIAQLANSINRQINERLKLTKELWRYLENIDAEETEKDIELRTATYPMFYEQASQMLAEIHGAMQGLEDVLSNISLSDADKAKLSVEFSVFDFENPDAEIEGFVKVQREEDGKAKIRMNVLTKGWQPRYDGEGYDENEYQIARGNARARGFEPDDAPEQVGARFEVPLRFGNDRTKQEIVSDLVDAIEQMGAEQYLRRKGYATTVHEFAHVLDALAYENLKQWIENNPNDEEARNILRRLSIMENIANRGDLEGRIRADYISPALRDIMGEDPQVSKYAANNEFERIAEQFTAWFLFSQASGISGDENMRKRNQDDNAEEILKLPMSMFVKTDNKNQKVILKDTTKSDFWQIMSRNHPVGQFVFGAMPKSKKATVKSMFDANQAVHDFYLVMSNAQEKSESPYTNNALRERIKARVMAGSEGGRPGQWSARKAQLVAMRYRKAGGGYKKGKRPNKKQRSLRKWTREKWRTSDGKPALRGGKMRRYLPDKVWGRLSPAQRAATNRKKIQGDKRGQQFVANTDTAKDKARNYRRRNKF